MLQDCRKKGSNPPDFQLSAPSPSFPHSNGKLEARRHDGLIWRRIRDVYRLGSATSSFVDNGVVTCTHVRRASFFFPLFPLLSFSSHSRFLKEVASAFTSTSFFLLLSSSHFTCTRRSRMYNSNFSRCKKNS